MSRDEIEELYEEYLALKQEHSDLIENIGSDDYLFSDEDLDIINDYHALKEMISPYLDYLE